MGIGIIGDAGVLQAIEQSTEDILNKPAGVTTKGALEIPAFATVHSNEHTGIIYNQAMLACGKMAAGGTTEFNNNYNFNTSSGTSGAGYYVGGLGHYNSTLRVHRYFHATPDGFLNMAGSYGENFQKRPFQKIGSVVSDSTEYAHFALIGSGWHSTSSNLISLTPASDKMMGYVWALANEDNKHMVDASALLSDGGTTRTLVDSGMSYNATTKTLVVMERDGYNHYARVFFDVTHPGYYLSNSVAPAKDWLDHILTRTVITSTDAAYKPTNSSNDDQYRGVPIMTDTGRIYYQVFIYNNGVTMSYWDVDLSGQTVGTNTNVYSASYTTSYGINNQDAGGGVQAQISNDTRYVMLAQNNYYHQGGYFMNFIDTKTGSMIKDYNNQTSTFYGIVPIQKDKFFFGSSDNHDSGIGQRFTIIDFDVEWRRVTGAIYTQQTNTITTQSAVTLQEWNRLFNTEYTSTAYGTILPVYLSPEQRRLVGGIK